MKRISRKAHPNLYEVLELFQREQVASEVTILQLEAYGAHRQKRRKVIEREQKIKHLQMSWLTETGILTHTFQQLDTVLFPLVLANIYVFCCTVMYPIIII